MTELLQTHKEWIQNLQKAVDAQACDESLWALPINRKPSIHEAHLAQALRRLHRVIEENDKDALQSIIRQSRGDV